MLEPLYRVRRASSVRTNPTHTDEHRCGNLHPELSATQLCGEPTYLLPLLHTHMSQSKKNSTVLLAIVLLGE
ncbi:hypothetical protein C0J52_25225 [Blattella germanica]|nr:hypothetical protein C0J52_25225 [Blattella germanica]